MQQFFLLLIFTKSYPIQILIARKRFKNHYLQYDQIIDSLASSTSTKYWLYAFEEWLSVEPGIWRINHAASFISPTAGNTIFQGRRAS
jgi:hypothetical protein